MRNIDESITYHKNACDQCILESIKAYYNKDLAAMNEWDAEAIDHLKSIEELEKAKKESEHPVYERRGWA